MENEWRSIIKEALKQYDTPFYIFDFNKIKQYLNLVKKITIDGKDIQHYFSFKTTPVKQFIKETQRLGMGIEVVSEYELLGAINLNYPSHKILVNGVQKHTWLKKYSFKKLNINFDSLNEFNALLPVAKKYNWKIGIRFHPCIEVDQDEPQYATQFGMTINEIKEALSITKKNNCKIRSVGFHLGTQIHDVSLYRKAINETIKMCNELDIEPENISIGGGFPVSYIGELDETEFITEIKIHIQRLSRNIKTLRSITFENGRYISSRCAILVVKINDIKFNKGMRYFICDGGRTNHALVSDWEKHNYFIYPQPSKSKEKLLTTVCGPTCMAYDHVVRNNLPKNVRIGDYFVWLDAGAYHIPWETRFSHGYSKVLSYRKNKIQEIRRKESFKSWWGSWQ